jgi:hypothetical protein
MAFIEQNGNIDGIPVSLYWILVKMVPERFYVPGEILTDSQGNKLDSGGNIITESEYETADFAYSEGKEKLRTTLVFHAYISYSERVEFMKEGKPPRKTKMFVFDENYTDVIDPTGFPLDFYYNHPLLVDQISSDWVSDEE